MIMPGVSGASLAATLTDMQPSMRVLYTSGYAGDELRRIHTEHGSRFLTKPFLPHDLVRCVRDVPDDLEHIAHFSESLLATSRHELRRALPAG